MRMHKDMKYMRVKIKELAREQVNVTVVKFGKVVDIKEIEAAVQKRLFKKNEVNDLEEVMLKKLVYELRIQSTDLKDVYAAELSEWKVKISHSQKELLEVIKENTKRLDLLKILNREKKELAELLSIQPHKKDHIEKLEQANKECLKDVMKLEEIVEKQCEELQDLKIEIKMLKTKGLPPRPPKEKETDKEEDMMEKKWEHEEYIMEEEKPFSADIHGYFSVETKDIVNDLVVTLLEDVHTELEKRSTEDMVHAILNGVMRCASVRDIINEIINNLPFEPTADQQSLIESTAERLYGLQEPEVTEDTFARFAIELLQEIVDEVMLIKGQPHFVIFRMVERLVQSLPFDFIMQEACIDEVTQRLSESVGDVELSTEDLAKVVDSIPSIYRTEMTAILDVILERVYGIGIDYLYVIKY